jgi:hypothetical protein
LNERIKAKNISKIKVVLWEHANAWAAYSVERGLDTAAAE